MQFLFGPLTWGFLLIGVPILVHLINLLRHRRQKWAAMEFLLESYRRNRRWVMLKQWLLLLARILAMTLLVIMLAKWITNSQWISMIGGRINHHFVLLDDSYSMGAVGPQNESAYTRALRAVSGLLRDISNQPGDHQITLIRFSRAELALRGSEPVREQSGEESAARLTDGSTNQESGGVQGTVEGKPLSQSQDNVAPAAEFIDRAADLLAQTVPRDPQRLIERLNATQPTDLACSPETAIELITPAIASQTGELPVVYLLTDLRRNQFAEAESLGRQFEQLSKQDVPIHLIDCSESEAANLTLNMLIPEQEVWAANVPLLVRFSIKNPSTLPARNVVAKIRSVEYPCGETIQAADQEYSGRSSDLPPLVIESIEPGQTVTRQFQVVFSSAGQHVIEVSLPDDVLKPDNRRWCVIDIQRSQRVLLVDGDVRQMNAFYLESVISPGERLNTGLTFERVDPSYLRDVSQEELGMQDVVALLDVPRLDAAAVDKLIAFAQGGGGVLAVMGENTNLTFVNEVLYREGQGLMPVELEGLAEPLESTVNGQPSGTSGPQVAATEHSILQPLNRLSSSPFFALQIRKHWIATSDSVKQPGVEVVATGPEGQPLIVDRPVGAGRVLALLTGFGQQLSSWAQDPTFVVLALRSLGYLGSFRRAPTEAPVASKIEMRVADTAVLPEGDVLLPSAGGQRVRLLRTVDKDEKRAISKLSVSANMRENIDRSVLDGLLRSGIFECWMTNADGTFALKNFAHNVAPEEGDLEQLGHQEVAGQFPGVDLKVRSSANFVGGLSSRESSQSNLAMALLVLLLMGEQMLAYSASYHPRASGLSDQASRSPLTSSRGQSIGTPTHNSSKVRGRS